MFFFPKLDLPLVRAMQSLLKDNVNLILLMSQENISIRGYEKNALFMVLSWKDLELGNLIHVT